MDVAGCLEISCEVVGLDQQQPNQADEHQHRKNVMLASVRPVKERCFVQKRRRAIDLVAVIDCSGSMAGESMSLVQQSLEFVVQQLCGETDENGLNDRLCIIGFANEAAVVLPFTEMTMGGKKFANEQIKKLVAHGGTNLSGGLYSAFSELGSRAKETRRSISSVVLLTDGLANRGVLDPARVVGGAEAYLNKFSFPVSVFTFGIGLTHDPIGLTSIAHASEGGVYKYLQDADEIPFSFEKCLGGLFSIVAQNIRLVYNPSHLKLYDRRGAAKTRRAYPSGDKMGKNANLVSINLGDIYVDETKDLVFLVNPNVQATQDVVVVELQYFDVVDLKPKAICKYAVATQAQDTLLRVVSNYNRILAVDAMNSVFQSMGESSASQKKLRDSLNKIRRSSAFSAGDNLTNELVETLKVMTDAKSCPSHLIHSLSSQYISQRMMASGPITNVVEKTNPNQPPPIKTVPPAVLLERETPIQYVSFGSGNSANMMSMSASGGFRNHATPSSANGGILEKSATFSTISSLSPLLVSSSSSSSAVDDVLGKVETEEKTTPLLESNDHNVNSPTSMLEEKKRRSFTLSSLYARMKR